MYSSTELLDGNTRVDAGPGFENKPQPWIAQILPYIGGVSTLNSGDGLYGMSGTVIQCPSDSFRLQSATSNFKAIYFPAIGKYIRSGYGINNYLCGLFPDYTPAKVTQVNKIVGLIGDTYCPGVPGYACFKVYLTGSWQHAGIARHSGDDFSNVAFTDGHAASVPRYQVDFGGITGNPAFVRDNSVYYWRP